MSTDDCLGEETILALVEGHADAAARDTARDHLAACAECRRWVARIAETALTTGAGDGEHPGDGGDVAPSNNERLGRYRMGAVIGMGAMGVVLSAHDELLGRDVALKLMRRGASDEARGRFLREARAASALSHPGVVAVHDVFTTADGRPVLVMDRLEGETLRDRLGKGPLTDAETIELIREVCDALDALHERGIVHRDLKPENIFLERRGTEPPRAKLLDFGVAKLVDGPLRGDADHTVEGALIGTPHYMAPEQAFGARDLDGRADLWSLGVIVYECVSGRRPFRASSAGEALEVLARRDFPRLRDVAPNASSAVVTLVQELLVDREQRPADARATRARLQTLLAQPKNLSPSPWRRGLAALGLLVVAGAAALTWARPKPPSSVDTSASAAIEASEQMPGVDPTPPAPSASVAAPTVPVATTQSPLRASRVNTARVAPASAEPPREDTPRHPDAGGPGTGPGKLLTKPPF